MKIVVLATAASSGGALTVLESLFKHVNASPGPHQWLFRVSVPHLTSTQQVEVRTAEKHGWMRRLAYEAFGAMKSIQKERPDVVISLQNTLPRGIRCRQVLYLHQPIPFQTARRFRFFKRTEVRLAIYQHVISRLIFRSARRADVIVVQTKWMRDAVLAKGLSQPDRVVAIPLDAADLNLPAKPTQAPFDREHFVYPTSPVAYKNNKTLLRACTMVAESGNRSFVASLTLPGSSNQPNVEFIGQIPRDELIAQLSTSTLVFPSQVETFGLPLLEGRALGTVILAADREYAHEVLDGYDNAHFFDPNEPAGLAALMSAVLDGRLVRKPLAAQDPDCRDGSGWSRVLRAALGR